VRRCVLLLVQREPELRADEQLIRMDVIRPAPGVFHLEASYEREIVRIGFKYDLRADFVSPLASVLDRPGEFVVRGTSGVQRYGHA
tara:strand:+ start:574 stop:831 length:258 start_codon:yes stop_codon:yes gene_type:complete